MANPPPTAESERQSPAATLGDVLYAGSKTPAPEQEWTALVKAAAAGDRLALHGLYERAHRPVFTLLVRLTADRRTAEDLTVEVFHEVWRTASEYDPAERTVLAWIMNKARARAVERLGDGGGGSELRGQTERLGEALAALTPYEREAIEATFFDGRTHAEAAARLHQPPGAIKSRIRSGLHKLRDRLSAEAGAR